MKNIILSTGACLLALNSFGQLTEIVSEVYADHSDTGIEALEGMTTYRVYAVFTNELDEVSAVYGDVSSPLSLTSSEGFFQSEFGSAQGWNINTAFFAFAAEAEYDSWITIGASNSQEVTGQPNSIGIDEAIDSFEAGGDFLVNTGNGGSWFTLYGDTQAQAGPDLKVLLAQLTTSGSFTGTFNVQVFLDGDQSNPTLVEGLPFSSNSGAIFGCMDETATNYNPDATEAGESCVYPCALELTVEGVEGNSCPGSDDGSIVVTEMGGQLGVSFGLGDEDPLLAVGTFDGLVGGMYTINAIDGAGCTASVEVEIIDPSPITVTASLTESVSCAGDSDAVISGMADGGAGDYSYSLYPDFSESSAELLFDGLSAGLYTVYAQDANGCSVQSISISVANPQPITVTVAGGQGAILDATCADSQDGLINVLTLGGAGTIESMLFSTNGMDFISGNLLSVGAGTFTIYAMDVNGCVGQTQTQYTVNAPDPILIDAEVMDILCFGDQNGMVSFNAEGGVGGLTYSFDGSELGELNSFGELFPGDYIILVEDEEGCQAEMTATVADTDSLVATVTSSDVSCFGDTNGDVQISAEGGTNAYEYSADGTEFSSSPIFIDLIPGTYTYYVQDSNECQTSVEATINEPDELTVTGTIMNDTGAGDGSLDIDIAGGNGGNTISWTGPDSFTSADEDLTGLVSGEYTVTITDSNDCTVTATFGVPVGVDEFTFLNSAVVSPNPSNGLFQLTWSGANGEDLDVSIYDGQGRLVFSKLYFNQMGDQRVPLNLSGVANGIYQLQIRADKQVRQLQLLKQ